MPDGALLIMCRRKPVALAGIMGGADTEIKPSTQSMLLESANFNPYVIRRCANRLGHRTDASARFEKSLDPNNTVLGIQRFVYLGKSVFEELTLASRLSDAYPKPLPEVTVTLDPDYASRFMGHQVSRDEITRILTALEFKVTDQGDTMQIEVPSFRATRDIEIEADVIEEIARFVGYNTIEPSFPEVTVRALDRNPLQSLERASLRLLTQGLGMAEIFRYLWYDSGWCDTLRYDPGNCVNLRNPAAVGAERLRKSLLPGLLAAADLNRHHFSEFKLVELGSAFPLIGNVHVERRRIGILFGLRSKTAEDRQLAELKGAIDTWAWQVLAHQVDFVSTDAEPAHPWEHPYKTAAIRVADRDVGRVGAAPLDLRRRIDDHLAAWSFVWAEWELDALTDLLSTSARLAPVPAYPEVELDFSVLVDGARRFTEIRKEIGEFDDPLLRRLTFVGSYEGKSVPAGKRSMTFRVRIGDPRRTLVDEDVVRFREAFDRHLAERGAELRKA
jgi:phenylalanyl-tRNA synthetase beta chain